MESRVLEYGDERSYEEVGSEEVKTRFQVLGSTSLTRAGAEGEFDDKDARQADYCNSLHELLHLNFTSN